MEKGLKRRKGDEISELPESILLHILSFLNMKEVVKTSVLSKQWEYIWTAVPTLTFKYDKYDKYEYREEKIRPFVIWVHKTLLQCDNNTVRKLSVKFRYLTEFASDVDLWAKFVARNNIQDLTLDFEGSNFGLNSYKLPRSLCQNSSLSSLSISNCIVSLGVKICWTSLKSLSIARMRFDNDIMSKILSGSPMLQVLKISYCISDFIHIKSNSLRELVIDSSIVRIIDISAPNIQSLCILRRGIIRKLMLCSSTLFRAELDFQFNVADKIEHFYEKFMTVFESILPVVQLEAGFNFLEALSLLGNNKSLSSPFSRLTFLKLNGIMDKTDIVGIICLLKCSPNLEKLVVNKIDTFESECQKRSKSLEKLANKYWKSEKIMEKFELLYLKTVKFNGFKEVDEYTSVLLQLLSENAVQLDNIVIDLGDLPMVVMPKLKPSVA